MKNTGLNFDQKSILDIYLSAPKITNYHRMYSNGSSGEIRKYATGPLIDFWLSRIEPWLEGMGEPFQNKVHLLDRFPLPIFGPEFIKGEGFFRINSRSVRYEQLLSKMLETLPKSTIIFSHPNVLLHISRCPLILQTLNKIKDKVHCICSTDFEAFYDVNSFNSLGLSVNDKMINWRSGLNFCTCSFGNKHVLPLFIQLEGGYHNLLNLADKKMIPTDDYFKLNSTFQCKCGHIATDFDFIPHVHQSTPNYDLKIAQKLKSKYLNFQFFGGQNTLQLHYTVDGPLLDDLEEFGAELHPNSSFLVGSRLKMPSFWSGRCRFITPQVLL